MDGESLLKQKIRSYQDLQVWQEAMELVAMAYRMASQLPQSERYTLVPQITRAAVSVPANIAEGQGSNHRRVFLNHLSIARGSLLELETYVALVTKLGFIAPASLESMRDRIGTVGRLLSGLIRALKARVEASNAAPENAAA